MAQWVKDLVLSLQWLGLLLWCGFDPWPRNFHMLEVQPKKKKKNLENISILLYVFKFACKIFQYSMKHRKSKIMIVFSLGIVDRKKTKTNPQSKS